MRRSFAAALAASLLAPHAAGAVTSVPVTPIAVQGETAPGTGLPFFSARAPRINAAGQVAFTAQLDTSVPDGTDSLWVWENGSLQLVATEGDSAPGTGATHSAFAVVGLNDAGQMLVAARVAGAGVTTSNDEVLFVGTPDDYAVAVREGSPLAPGSDVVGIGATVELGDDGDILISARLGSTTNLNAVVWGTPGAMTAVANERPFSLGFAGSGRGYFGLNPISGAADSMFAGPLAAATEIWRQGDPFVPVPGATVTALEGKMSEAGALFSAFLAGPDDWALAGWSESGGFETLLLAGSPAPGHEDLTFDSADGRRLVIGRNGDVAGIALLRNAVNSSRMGLFSGSLEGGLEFALAAGDAAPGIPDATINTLNQISNVTADGLFVFWASVQPGAGGDLVQALYALRPDGTIDLLLKTGDVIEWGAGETRVVDLFDFAGAASVNDPGGNRNDRALSDAGQLALQVNTGGYLSAFLLDVTPIPEPGTAWLVACGLLGLRCARTGTRRR
jgi:hypothetical protein